MKKIINTLRKYTPLRLRILFGPFFAYISYFYQNKLQKNTRKTKILTPIETLELIANDNMSAIRFGDGEMSLMYSENLGFQKADTALGKVLVKILQSNEPKLLICIPGIWGDLSHFSKRSFWFTLHHKFKYGYRWENFIQYSQTYGDAFITRPFLNYKDRNYSEKIFEKLFTIWKNQDIVVIEGSKSRLGVGNDLFAGAKSVKRILCPAENAFEKYEAIKEESMKLDKDKLVLVSLGPTAKVLAYDLFLAGFRVIDIGHIDMEYEMYLRNSHTLVKVPYKYFNEINERNPEDCNDHLYLSQIIAKIE